MGGLKKKGARKYKHEAEGFLEDTLKMIQMKNEGMSNIWGKRK